MTLKLSSSAWSELERSHQERALTLTQNHRQAKHENPTEDFLFRYYAYSPAHLKKWHPGWGIELSDASTSQRSDWKWYTQGSTDNSIRVDHEAFRQHKRALIESSERILQKTYKREPSFSCFAFHEWAMVYQSDTHRHNVPLRLSQQETDEVVRSHTIKCTHFDAYRFFTPDALELNAQILSRHDQERTEQPGCLHANMDLYKWAIKLGPLIPGNLLLDTFELAQNLRMLDVQASPYDMSDWGLAPIKVETAEGKSEFILKQRKLTEASQDLRRRILDRLTTAPNE